MPRLCSLAALLVLLPSLARAAPVWVGDMEPGDLSQWNHILNGEIDGKTYAAVAADEVVQGQWAARIELHDDAVWPNGLKRVEVNHSPAPGRTAEGAVVCFAWSFYLPATLPTEPSQQIGYWESNNSYQQMMAFEVSGERISFSTRQPNNVVQWDQDGLVTAGAWHRIAMRVAWSKDPNLGAVDVWFDGVQVVTAAAAKTLADDNDHFTQLGLLRGAVEFADVPVIYIDDAVEGDALEDVRPELPDPDDTTTTADATTGDATTDATTTDDAPDVTTTSSGDATTTTTGDPPAPTTGIDGADASDTSGPSTTPSGDAAPDDDADAGCGCTHTTAGAPALLVLLAARRRRREPAARAESPVARARAPR